MPRQNSTWAPSGCRVRSPIQSMCARGVVPVAGLVESSPRHRLLVAEQQGFMAGVEVGALAVPDALPRSRPQACMKPSASAMRSASSSIAVRLRASP